ncbi:DUF721 domain-containing protein [Candidatus Omnitrophota bacterium]
MKKIQPTSMKDVLKLAIREVELKTDNIIKEHDIYKVWSMAAGEEASKHSAPVKFNKSKLVVGVDSPTWIYQLSLNKDKIEKKINAIIKSENKIIVQLRAGDRSC